VGEKGRRSLWRPKDHVLNHESTSIRLIRASGDYISQYHEETRAAYAIAPTVDFEFRQDEYHRHWATSINETFSFHTRAFANPKLDTTPTEWNYSSAFRHFSVRGYDVSSDVTGAGLILFENVRQQGFRIRTRQWAPDGPPALCSSVSILTAPLYEPRSKYEIADLNFSTGKMSRAEFVAAADGRLTVNVDCAGHQLSIVGPGTMAQPFVLLPVTGKDVLRVSAGVKVPLPLQVLNPAVTPLHKITAELTSSYPTVEILQGRAHLEQIEGGSIANTGDALQVRFASGATGWEHARLNVKVAAQGVAETMHSIDVLVAPADLPQPQEIAILDGRTKTFPVFRQKGNQGGGGSVERTVTEGTGNGDGVLQPGEKATIWLKFAQGLDAFDRGNWCRAKVYTDSPWMTEIGDIQEEKQRVWTGAQNRTSLIELSRQVPGAAEIPAILDCESWSFHFTPDVRYGVEPLYQAFQLHKHHLFRFRWNASLAKQGGGQ
jgi:hypothetical protein